MRIRPAEEVDQLVEATGEPVDLFFEPSALRGRVGPVTAKMLESLRSGMQGFTEDALVLVVASDLPALDAPAVDEFVDAVLARDLDVAYACLERRFHVAAYPEFPHTWARMRDGRYCGGGLVALRPRVLPRLNTFMDALGRARKSPLRLAGLFGWDVLARFALGRLAIEHAEARASHLLRARVGAVRCTHAQVALNVDRVADVTLANARFAGS